MSDSKDDLPATNEDIPTKEPTPEPGIETPDEQDVDRQDSTPEDPNTIDTGLVDAQVIPEII